MSEKAILFDSSKCTACKGCQVACKCWNELPSPTELNACAVSFTGTYQNPPDINGTTRLIISFNETEPAAALATKPIGWAFGRRSCQHCDNAPCVAACPHGALSQDPDTGFVNVDQAQCVGCGYCSSACPFDVPRYDGGEGPLAQLRLEKCTGCLDRVKHGMEPACVATCQPDALTFGDRDELVAIAREKVAWLRERGYENACVAGDSEDYPTHVLHVLKYGYEAHGMVEHPQVPATVEMTRVMKPITGALSGLTVVGLATMFGLAAGYKRNKLAYNPETGDTIDVDRGEVVKQGDGQDEMSVMEHITENIGRKGGR